MTKRTAHEVTLFVHVNDRSALWTAACASAVKNGMMPVDIRDFLGTQRRPKIDGCLRMLLDPGVSPAGTEIQDSTCDAGIDLD